jgi:hypothetical protein
MYVFLCHIAKISDWFLEQQISSNFCVKLGKNASDNCAMLSEVYRGVAMERQVFLSGINDPRKFTC